MITRALMNFIRFERSTGVSDDSIAATLKSRGWTAPDIEHALASTDRAVIEAPRPGMRASFLGLMEVVWSVYETRWKRFTAIGLLYILASVVAGLYIFAVAIPAMPDFISSILHGDASTAFLLGAPYLLLGMIVMILLQVWFESTLFLTSLRRGDSVLERIKVGATHALRVLGIKLTLSVLLLIVFVPVLLVTFFTQNILVLLFFSPLFFIGMAAAWFLFSLSVPAYFHGVPWRESLLASARVVSGRLTYVLFNEICFVLLIMLIAFVFRHTGPISVLVAVCVISPFQALFLLTLYRSVAIDEREAPVAPVSKEETRPPAPKPVGRSAKKKAA